MIRIVIIFIGLLIGTATVVNSQQPLIWRIGGWGELHFNGSQVNPLLSSDTLRINASNSPFFDDNGNLTIFSNGIAVTNSSIDTIQNGFLNFNPDLSSSLYGSDVLNGTLILPRPGYSNQQYIFHSSYYTPQSPSIEFYGKLYYSIIDMSLNGGTGGITNTKDVLLKDSVWFGNINAVRHGNGRDWWLISGKHLSDTLYTWLVLQDTILGPFGQKKGMIYPGGQAANQTAFNTFGDKFTIGYVYQTGNTKKLLLSGFNRCTGELNNGIYLTMPDSANWNYGVYGVEFSPSERYLYASTPNAVYQFDLLASNIQSSRVRVGFHDHLPNPFQSSFGNMKLAPDGKIYIQTGAGNYSLDVINNPDSVGMACNVQLRQIDYNSLFGTYISISAVPHYPNYYLGALTGSPCDTLVGIDESLEIKLGIAPNPVTNSCTLSFPIQNNEGKLEVKNVLGEVVIQTTIAPSSQNKLLNLDNLPAGIYYCQIKWKYTQSSVKILKF